MDASTVALVHGGRRFGPSFPRKGCAVRDPHGRGAAGRAGLDLGKTGWAVFARDSPGRGSAFSVSSAGPLPRRPARPGPRARPRKNRLKSVSETIGRAFLPWAQLRPWCAARPGPAPWCTSCGAALVPWCSSHQLRRALSHQLRRMRGPSWRAPWCPAVQLCPWSCAAGALVQLMPCALCPVSLVKWRARPGAQLCSCALGALVRPGPVRQAQGRSSHARTGRAPLVHPPKSV
jgi:hypothetical protein